MKTPSKTQNMLDHIKLKFLIPLVIILIGVVYNVQLKKLLDSITSPWSVSYNSSTGLFSKSKLSSFDGISEPKLYLAVLGVVFDVTAGRKHYANGKSYHYFVGKDGSRSLITGNFKDEGKDKDHVLDLNCNDLFALLQWQNTFREKYNEIGLLIGRYYDEEGKETSYTKEFQQKIEECHLEKEKLKKEEIKYPPCNSAWSVDEGTKVWCTKSSGGVTRNWVGLPYQLYTPAVKRPRCVCINLEDTNHPPGNIKKYDNCDQSIATCYIP